MTGSERTLSIGRHLERRAVNPVVSGRSFATPVLYRSDCLRGKRSVGRLESNYYPLPAVPDVWTCPRRTTDPRQE